MLEDNIHSIHNAIKDTKNLTEKTRSIVAGCKGVFFHFLSSNCSID